MIARATDHSKRSTVLYSNLLAARTQMDYSRPDAIRLRRRGSVREQLSQQLARPAHLPWAPCPATPGSL
eukprot:15441440-Alexandrium_andersonii.AAC.1